MAVKCILTGQDKIFVNGILRGDGNGNVTAADETEVELVDLPQEIFWATYGTTTAVEINAAKDAGKLVMVVKGKAVYTLTKSLGTDTFYFYTINPNNVGAYLVITMLSGEWLAPVTYGSICDRKSSISLPVASWDGSDPYVQAIIISGSTANTKVDIQPSEELYDQLVADNVGYLAIKNVSGTLTAVAKGGKPSVDLTVQVTYNNVY